MDWTLPVSIAVFFLGSIAVLLVAVPRVRAIHQLRELQKASIGRVHTVAEAFDTFRQKDMAVLKAKVDDTAKDLATLKSAAAMKQIGR